MEIIRRERVLVTRHHTKLEPDHCRFGFDFERVSSGSIITKILDITPCCKLWLVVSAVNKDSPASDSCKIRTSDILYSVDHLNVHKDSVDKILRYIRQQADRGNTTKFVFIRIQFYIQQRIPRFRWPKVKMCAGCICNHGCSCEE